MHPSAQRRIRLGMLIVVLIVGAAIGLWMVRGWFWPISPPIQAMLAPDHLATAAVWTCSMHPQIRLPQAGACPICGMPLVPATRGEALASSATASAQALTLDAQALQMADVATVTVQRRPAVRHLRTVGIIDYNETGLANIPSRVDGYLERLYVDQTGVPVRRGEHLAEIYSPALVVAQQELLIAQNQPAMRSVADAIRLRLQRSGISEQQITALAAGGSAQERLILTAPIDGIVIEKLVVTQSPVTAGMVLYRLANLDSVWAQIDIFEQDLELVRPGQAVELRSDAQPDRVFTGRVTFIDPVLRPETRSARARVVVANPQHRLKPNQYIHAEIAIPVRADGHPGPTEIEGKWTCPMHPEVVVDSAGACPRCGMALRVIPRSTDDPESLPPLVVPTAAVLSLGTRAIVWQESATGAFQAVALRLGPLVDDNMVVVLGGLNAGDRIVARGGFLIDSEAQIRGLPSLLNPDGGPVPVGHDHGGSVAPTPGPTQGSRAPPPPAAPAPIPAAHQH